MHFRLGLISAILASIFFCGAKAGVPEIAALQIKQPINELQRVTLYGNTRPEANARNDRGMVPDSMPIGGLQLVLRKSAAQQHALDKLIHDLHDRTSAGYHKWIKPGEFGWRFGGVAQDIAKIVGWLSSHGFRIDGIPASATRIDFSGTAGDIREAFHTEIHRLRVRGENRFANMTDPQIPAALAPAVVGVASLNDFRPHPQCTAATNCQPYNLQNGDENSQCYDVVPKDLWTIYNFPNFTLSNSGLNVTIVLMEDSDIYKDQNGSFADWNNFRTSFMPNTSAYTEGTLHVIQPSGTETCSDPGLSGDEPEATLDAE